LGLLSRKAARKRVRERNKKLQLRIKLRNSITHEHRDIETKRTIRPMSPMLRLIY
jgi:hypothetical protein